MVNISIRWHVDHDKLCPRVPHQLLLQRAPDWTLQYGDVNTQWQAITALVDLFARHKGQWISEGNHTATPDFASPDIPWWSQTACKVQQVLGSEILIYGGIQDGIQLKYININILKVLKYIELQHGGQHVATSGISGAKRPQWRREILVPRKRAAKSTLVWRAEYVSSDGRGPNSDSKQYGSYPIGSTRRNLYSQRKHHKTLKVLDCACAGLQIYHWIAFTHFHKSRHLPAKVGANNKHGRQTLQLKGFTMHFCLGKIDFGVKPFWTSKHLGAPETFHPCSGHALDRKKTGRRLETTWWPPHNNQIPLNIPQ